jgi:hypothetical protein
MTVVILIVALPHVSSKAVLFSRPQEDRECLLSPPPEEGALAELS